MQMRFLPITHKMITTKKSAFYLVLKKHILIQKLQNYDNHCKILPSAEVSRDWRYDLELHAWARIDILDACSFVRPFVCRSFRWWVCQTGVYQIWGKMKTIKCCGSHKNALIHSFVNLFVHSFIHSFILWTHCWFNLSLCLSWLEPRVPIHPISPNPPRLKALLLATFHSLSRHTLTVLSNDNHAVLWL